MNSILNILQKPLIDESIIKKEYHTYLPYLQTFKNSDEIRIAIQNQDLYVLPSESLLYIEGVFKREQPKDEVANFDIKLENNIGALLFEEIRYEINGMEVDKTRHVGIASTIKNYVSLTPNQSVMMENGGWSMKDIIISNGYFNFCIPLKMLLGFAEDFNKILVNCKHELILLRSKTDEKSFSISDSSVKATLNLTNVSWKVPHIQLADFTKLEIFKIIKSSRPLSISFRSWDCHYNPLLTQSTNNIWNVKLTSNNERPRFLLIVFYDITQRKFIHCDLNDIKIHLNSTTYPYDNLNLKFEQNRYAILYDMYCKFQQSYYGREYCLPLLTKETFKKDGPVIIIDVSHQNEMVKTGSMDIKIDFKTEKNIPPKTAAYCLLIQDRLLEYIPITGNIKKII